MSEKKLEARAHRVRAAIERLTAEEQALKKRLSDARKLERKRRREAMQDALVLELMPMLLKEGSIHRPALLGLLDAVVEDPLRREALGLPPKPGRPGST